jgi:hypothetical protein
VAVIGITKTAWNCTSVRATFSIRRLASSSACFDCCTAMLPPSCRASSFGLHSVSCVSARVLFESCFDLLALSVLLSWQAYDNNYNHVKKGRAYTVLTAAAAALILWRRSSLSPSCPGPSRDCSPHACSHCVLSLPLVSHVPEFRHAFC